MSYKAIAYIFYMKFQLICLEKRKYVDCIIISNKKN